MNQTRMMYGFIDEMEKTAVIPFVGAAAGMAARLAPKAVPWLMRAGKGALNFAKSDPGGALNIAQTAKNVVRPPKPQQPTGQVQGIKPAPTDSSAMRTNFG